MCDTCGVTEAQYRRASWLLSQHSWAALYRNVSEVDPALMGIEVLTAAQIEFVNDSITAYLPTHSDLSEAMSADELRAWFNTWESEREAKIAVATLAGC